MTLLKFTTVKNIMEESLPDGVNFLVSERAVNQMSREIDEFVLRVVRKACRMAGYSKRVTIKAEDILMAMEILKGLKYGDD